MIAGIFRIFSLALLLLLPLSEQCFAQVDIDPRTGCDSCRFRIDNLQQPFDLRGMWLFTRDDRPENKDIALDTRDWKLLPTPGPWRKAYGDGQNFSVGWHRAVLEFAPELTHQDVVLLLDSYVSRTQIYLDGQLVFERPNDANTGRSFHFQSIPVRFTVTKPRHVVAIRVDTLLMQGLFQLPFELRRYVPDAPDVGLHQLRGNEVRWTSGVIAIAFGLFLLLVYSKTRYGMYLQAALTSLFGSLYPLATTDMALRYIPAEKAYILSYFGLGCVYFLYRFTQYFHEPMPRTNRVLGSLLLLVSLGLVAMLPSPDIDVLQPLRTLHFLLVFTLGVCTVHTAAQALRKRRRGAGILFVTLLLFLGCGLNDMLLALGLISSYFLIPIGLFFTLVAMLYVTSSIFASAFSDKQKLLTTLQAEQERTAVMLHESRKQEQALQRSYAMMAKIQSNAGMGLWQWVPETDEMLCSQSALDQFHYWPANNEALPPGFAARFRGTKMVDFVHPDDRQRFLHNVSNVLQDRKICTGSYRAVRDDGVQRLIFIELNAEADEQGEVRSIYGFTKDITEEQRTEELRAAIATAEAAQHAAETANRMKSEFLAMISHEMRTPLGGVIGMLKLGLKDIRLAEDTRGKFSVGLASAESLLQIINDILDYSKLEAGKMTLECIDFDLPAVVQDSHSILEERAEAKGLALTMQLPAHLPRWWQGDPVRLRQVLINLVGNAIKFTEAGAVRIALTQGDDGWLEFAVSDTGIGIAADALPRLFQKFEQADISTTRKFGGTGLGLAICRSIIQAMGGTIGVQSTPGVGTTFCFRVPLHPGQQSESVQNAVNSRHTHHLCILCAEDGKTNQLIVREFIESMGHRIDIAEDGAAALVALAARDYDLVLMDSRMPHMDGLSALRCIRAGEAGVRDATIPVVALTANVGAEERERFFAAGANGFLGKPIDEDALHTELARMIALLHAKGRALTPQPAAQATAGTTAEAIPAHIAALDALFGLDAGMEAAPPPSPPKAGFSRNARLAMQAAFASEAPRLLGVIEDALKTADMQAIALAAHSLKGSAGYFGASELQELCRRIEKMADAGNPDGIAAIMPPFAAAVHTALLQQTQAQEGGD